MSAVIAMTTFKMSKLTAQILDILKREGVASLKEFGEIPLQVGMATEVMLHPDCPLNTVLSFKGRTVQRYVELVSLDVVESATPKSKTAVAATAGVPESDIPASLAGEVKLMYLAIPVADEMDADGLLEYVGEMVDTIREKLVADGYSVEERETLVGIHKEYVEHSEEVHVFIDSDVLEDDPIAQIIAEFFDEGKYEQFDSAEYDERYQLPELLRGLPEDVMTELAEKLDIKSTNKKKKLTVAMITEAILKMDTAMVTAAISELIDPAADQDDDSQEEGEEHDVEEILSALTSKQLHAVAEHMELEIGKQKSNVVLALILEQDDSDVIDALDALDLMPESEEEPATDEADVAEVLQKLDLASLKATAKSLKLDVNRKATQEELLAALSDADPDEVAEALIDLGFADVDVEEEEDPEEEEEEEVDTVELEDALSELTLEKLVEVAEALELEMPKKQTLATLTKAIVAHADTQDSLTEAVEAVAGLAEEEEEEEGESLETLYSVLEGLKATRGNAAGRKEALADMSETDLTEAKRKDVVALFAIAEMTELDDEAKELMTRLAGPETELSETVLGYFTKVFTSLITVDAEEEEEEKTTPAKKTTPGKGKTNRKPASKK